MKMKAGVMLEKTVLFVKSGMNGIYCYAYELKSVIISENKLRYKI